jgi:hypothetical protein
MSQISKVGQSSIFESMLLKLAEPVQAPPISTPTTQTEPQTFTGEVPQKGTGWGRIELKNLFEEWLDLNRSYSHLTTGEYREKMTQLEDKILAQIQEMREEYTPEKPAYRGVDETMHFRSV